jgi:predicted nucleic acid-binding protein
LVSAGTATRNLGAAARDKDKHAHPRKFAQVRGIVERWVSFPHVRIIHLSENALERFFDLLEEAGTGGNLTTDAEIALDALEHSATIASNDHDFDRFAGVKRINSLA